MLVRVRVMNRKVQARAAATIGKHRIQAEADIFCSFRLRSPRPVECFLDPFVNLVPRGSLIQAASAQGVR